MNSDEKQLSAKMPRGNLSFIAQIKFLAKLFGLMLFGNQSKGARTKTMLVRRQLAVLALFVFALTAIVGVYSYSSASVTVNDSMFFVKRVGERIAVSLSSDEDAYNVYAKIAERRLDEFNYLVSNNFKAEQFSLILTANAEEDNELLDEDEEEVEKTLEMMLRATERGLNAIEVIDDIEKVEKALEVLESLQDKEKKALEDALTSIGIDEENENAMAGVILILEDVKYNQEQARLAREEAKENRKENKNARMNIETRGELDEKVNKDPEKVRQAIDQIENGLSEWRSGILNVSTSTDEYERLFAKIDDRMQKIDEALDEDKSEQAYGLLKSVEAFKNNAKYFAKKDMKKNKAGDNEEDSKKGDEEENENGEANNYQERHGSKDNQSGNQQDYRDDNNEDKNDDESDDEDENEDYDEKNGDEDGAMHRGRSQK